MAKKGTGQRTAAAKAPGPSPARWIEVINWKKAQPRMKASPNAWMKLYTSLLGYDVFVSLDERSQLLLIGLWLLAAQLGRHVLPADPAWLAKRIHFLKKRPSLKPLLEAKDMYGRAKPFIRFCPPPAEQGVPADADGPEIPSEKGKGKPRARSRKKDSGMAVATRARPGQRVRSRARAEQSRVEESREDKSVCITQSPRVVNSAPNLIGSGKGHRAKQSRTEQRTADPKPLSAQQSTNPTRPGPMDPTKPDAGGAKVIPFPGAPSMSDIPTVGDVLAERPHRYDGESQAFADAIAEALGLGADASERGCFASQWLKLCGDLPPPEKTAIKHRALKHALQVRRNARRCGSPGAVWLTKFKGLAAKYRRAAKVT